MCGLKSKSRESDWINLRREFFFCFRKWDYKLLTNQVKFLDPEIQTKFLATMIWLMYPQDEVVKEYPFFSTACNNGLDPRWKARYKSCLYRHSTSLSHSFFLFLSHALSLSLTHTLSHSVFLSLSLTRTLSLSLTRTLSLAFSLVNPISERKEIGFWFCCSYTSHWKRYFCTSVTHEAWLRSSKDFCSVYLHSLKF